MSKRFSMSEVALARRIRDGKDKNFLTEVVEAEGAREMTVAETLKRIADSPLVPSYGIEPPWWEQAIAETDQGMVWVTGFGWMGRDLWEDTLKLHEEELKGRRKLK